MCRNWLTVVVIGYLLSSLSSSADEPDEQKQKTLDYEQAIAPKYFYPVTEIDGHHKVINLVGTNRQTGVKQASGNNRCIPLLSPANVQNQSSLNSYPSIADLASNISFPVRNINMPVAPASGSINSALRLLSTFESHLSGSSSDESRAGDDESNDDDGSADDDEMAMDGFNVGDNVVRFRQNRLRLQGLNLTMLNIHIYADSEPKFALGITIRNTTLTGRFIYDGPTLISESKLAGYYRMSIDNVYFVASSNLTKKSTNLQSEQYDLVTNGFKLNITNLGYITIDIFDSKDTNVPTTSYLLRMLQRLLQRTIKRTYYSFETYIRETLENQSRKFIDCELTRFSPMLQSATISDSKKSSGSKPTIAISENNKQGQLNPQFSQTDLARIINGEIERSRLSSVSLPTFDYQQSIFGTSASIHFHNGSMNGLDHLNLNGETRVKLQDEHLIVNASIGWQNLCPYYSWKLYIGSPVSSQQTNLTLVSNNTNAQKQVLSTSTTPISKGFVAFNIKAIDFDAIITKGLGSNSSLIVEELIISRLENPKMDIGGLPGMNRVARAMVNFFMARLKQRVTNSIQPALKMHLERSLNQLSLFA